MTLLPTTANDGTGSKLVVVSEDVWCPHSESNQALLLTRQVHHHNALGAPDLIISAPAG